MRRWPVLATVIVAFAVAAMIGLGVWQLQRAEEKAALLERYRTAGALPPMAFPAMPGGGDEALFRKASALCLEPLLPRVEGGRNRRGEAGWRHIVSCRTGADGPGMLVDIGWSKDFKVKPHWRGGRVSGIIGQEADKRSLIGRTATNAAPPRLMLIAEAPAPGLQPSAPPSPEDIPNNHFAYAVQWFIFAALAGVIYVVALRRRGRDRGSP